MMKTYILNVVFTLTLLLVSSQTIFADFVDLKGMEDQKLILNMLDRKELPRNFRTSKTPYNTFLLEPDAPLPDRSGLSKVRMSGSAQFSISGLKTLIKTIDEDEFYLIDLREESHGFVNRLATSWYGKYDWGNKGLTPAEVEQDQKERLKQLYNQGIAYIYKSKNEDVPHMVPVKEVTTERAVAKALKVKYKRFYVTDHVHPSDQIVDDFIHFASKLSSKAHLHFHCKAGKGRTTTFMVMYDIMHNAANVSFEDILCRQWLIGGLKLDKECPDENWKTSYAHERVQFLKDFHQYVKENPDYDISWTEWKNKKSQIS